MIYVSVDVETSGLNPEKHQILSIGAIIEDTKKILPYEECPKFHAMIVANEIVGSPKALQINQNLISVMSEYLHANHEDKTNMDHHSEFQFNTIDDVVKSFFDFLFSNGFGYDLISGGQQVRIENGRTLPIIGTKTKPITITAAGKNFATFDQVFLKKLPWFEKLIRLRQRVIDPAVLFCDWKNDEQLPNLLTCKQRSNIDGIITHNALEDAWDVISVLRTKY
jgi:oligoribonuclease